MKSNIKYANILIIALAVAYFIIGGMNFFGYVGGKVILLCSIVSLAVAIVQIMDVVISALQLLETRIIKAVSYTHLDVYKRQVYERTLFTIKDSRFKSDRFLDEVKRSYTDLINIYVKDDKQKLRVFDRNGVYLPTKKIGKNNPKAE